MPGAELLSIGTKQGVSYCKVYPGKSRSERHLNRFLLIACAYSRLKKIMSKLYCRSPSVMIVSNPSCTQAGVSFQKPGFVDFFDITGHELKPVILNRLLTCISVPSNRNSCAQCNTFPWHISGLYFRAVKIIA